MDQAWSRVLFAATWCGTLLIFSIILTFSNFDAYGEEFNDPAARLAESLEGMGYSHVEIEECRVKFSRKLDVACPTNRAISYRRDFNLANLLVDEISDVTEQRNNEKKYYEFQIPPTSEYARYTRALSFFTTEVKVRYPQIIWPFIFDESTNEISDFFYEIFPKESDLNWWVLETCFGKAPDFDIIFRMSYSDKATLDEFRGRLIEYSDSQDCDRN